MPAPARASTSLTRRLIYDGSDAASRDVAERLVAVASSDYPRASALTGERLLQALTRGGDAGYVVPVDRRPLDPCRELAWMRERSPWLDVASMMPIADTRLHAIVRSGRGHLVTEWNGLTIEDHAVTGTP
jgi:hypothetical protein